MKKYYTDFNEKTRKKDELTQDKKLIFLSPQYPKYSIQNRHMNHINDKCISTEKSEKIIFREIPIEIYKKLISYEDISHPLTNKIVSEPWNKWIVIRRSIVSRWKSNRYQKY